MPRHFLLYADGGSRGNPGEAAFGAVISEDGKVVVELSERIGVATNNVAEYSGLVAGLQEINRLDPEAKVLVR
ncbi:MAG: reverse transcriptase-like protein, partial [Actinobacteria bacterium]|nr:reverse transcriptase-like protein [Actinomycetota bacterium]